MSGANASPTRSASATARSLKQGRSHQTMKRLIAAAALICGLTLAAAPQARPALQLKSAVILTRHGVRAPTWTPDRLNQYSVEPWPDFGVPPGNLTPRGRELMK